MSLSKEVMTDARRLKEIFNKVIMGETKHIHGEKKKKLHKKAGEKQMTKVGAI